MRRIPPRDGSGRDDDLPRGSLGPPGKSSRAAELDASSPHGAASPEGVTPEELALLPPDEQLRLVGGRLRSALDMIAALTWGIAESDGGVVADVPGGPAIRFKGVWYTREGLKDQVMNKDKTCIGAKYMPERIAMIDRLSPGQEFADWQALQQVLIGMQYDPDHLDAIGRERREADRKRAHEREGEKEKEKEKEPGAASLSASSSAPARPTTSLAPTIPLSEDHEQNIGKRAASHPASLYVSQQLAGKVTAFVERFRDRGGPDLYAQIGTDNKETAGAVGKDPATVKDALGADATLHEQMTHVLNFRAALANVLVDAKFHQLARDVAIEVGFDAASLDELAQGASSKEHDRIYELKSEIVKRKPGPPVTNARSAEEVGIPFSGRERAMWGSDQPSFGVGAAQVEVDASHPWVAEKQAQGFPVKSGPSTHTVEIFEIAKLLGLEHKLPPEMIRQAATGYLLPIGAHSMVEIEEVAAMFGCELCRGPEAYAQRLAQLGGLTLPPWQTGEQLFAALTADVGKPDEDNLLRAHHFLLAHGYAFAGFHGTSAAVCKNLLTIGFEDKWEKRQPDDPWRGLYVAPDLDTASGYTADKEAPQMLRVYAPAGIVARVTQARLSLDKGDAVLAELRGRLGHALPSSDEYFIIGREAEHEPDLEAVLSWAAAKQCIAIPSLHQPNNKRRGLASHSDFEAAIPDHTAAPTKLTFEGEHAPMSTGGNQFGPRASEQSDPRDWQPSERQRGHTEWGDGSAYRDTADARSGPNPQQVSQLRALGLDVHVGDSWQKVNAQSLPHQANAFSLQEMLAPLASTPTQSPAWTDFAAQFKSAEQPTEIEPQLYLSGHATASDLTWQASHVKFVLNCCQFTFPHQPGIAYEDLNVTGFDNGLFQWASQLLASHAGDGTLVHCIEGKNRSATVLTAYLMKRDKLTSLDAIRRVRARRPWAEPDEASLRDWEGYLKKAAD